MKLFQDLVGGYPPKNPLRGLALHRAVGLDRTANRDLLSLCQDHVGI